MELPHEWTSFWAALVLPRIPCKISIPEDTECTLTNIALDQEASFPPGIRVILEVSVAEAPPVAVSCLTPGQIESVSVDVQFAGGDRVTFTTRGSEVPVHLCGYLTGGCRLNIHNGATTE
jgi:hypothetical protein